MQIFRFFLIYKKTLIEFQSFHSTGWRFARSEDNKLQQNPIEPNLDHTEGEYDPLCGC